MIPTKKQLFGWSLPSKYTFLSFWLGLFFGVLSTLLTLYFGLRSDPLSEMLIRDMLVEKSTEVDITHVDSLRMLGDSEPYLIIRLKNKSPRPALNVRTDFYGLRGKVALTPTKSSGVYQSPDLAVQQNGELEIPVGPKSEIAKALDLRCISEFRFHSQSENPTDGVSIAQGFFINVSYNTIFEQKQAAGRMVYAIQDGRCS